jgi:hypothetical protein
MGMGALRILWKTRLGERYTPCVHCLFAANPKQFRVFGSNRPSILSPLTTSVHSHPTPLYPGTRQQAYITLLKRIVKEA